MSEALITPATVAVKSIKGDSAPFSITITENGTPVDFSGSALKIQLRYPTSNNIAVTLTEADDITLGGSGVATINTENVNALEVGDYKYDAQWTNSSGTKRTIINGYWSILYEATT